MDIDRAPSPGGKKPDKHINLRLLILQYTFPEKNWLICMGGDCHRVIHECEDNKVNDEYQCWFCRRSNNNIS